MKRALITGVTEQLSVTQIAYLAGLFDGEGSIHLRKVSGRRRPDGTRSQLRTYSLTVDVASGCHRETMEAVATMVKKGISVAHPPKLEGMNGGSSNKRWCWRVRLFTSQAADFLELIEPYLLTKKEQARLAIAFQRNKPGTGVNCTADREEYEAQVKADMTALNMRGDYAA